MTTRDGKARSSPRTWRHCSVSKTHRACRPTAAFLLGVPVDGRDQVANRGGPDGGSNDIAGFSQDDWRINKSLTCCLRLRYEIVGAWHEKEHTLGNFLPVDGGHHVVPNAQVA